MKEVSAADCGGGLFSFLVKVTLQQNKIFRAKYLHKKYFVII